MSAPGTRPQAWTIIVLNRGWGARTLLPAARRLADLGDRPIMLVYVVGMRRRPRRAWQWHGRRVILHALGPSGPSVASSLMRSATVTKGVRLAAVATGGTVMIRRGDVQREGELRAMRIATFAVDVVRPGPGGRTG